MIRVVPTSDREVILAVTPQTLTVNDVRRLLDAGADHSDIVTHLVDSGIWSTNGANEIVLFLTKGPDELLANHVPPPDGRLEKRARRRLSSS